ncbi:MAG: hypothetical protein Dbin4_01683, partial [Alphaproteobacteria bacterium]|nr:hypothetical protein [Alphaproteobacteria bacterium]
ETRTIAELAASSGSSLVGFLQSGTGAVSRTVQSKLRDVVSVKDFGAVGDGIADDTAEIQAAATAVGYGGTLYFPKGTYFVSATITLRGATKMLGDGVEATIIKRIGDYGDTFICGTSADQSEPARSFEARKIRFQHSDPYVAEATTIPNKATSGAHLRIYGAQEAVIEDCWFRFMTRAPPKNRRVNWSAAAHAVHCRRRETVSCLCSSTCFWQTV